MGDVSAEPSMEDILSSIKRIIAEDGDGGQARSPRRAPRAATTTVPPRPVVVASDDDDADEILELNDPAPMSDAAAASDPLVSPTVAQASRGSLDALTRMIAQPEVADAPVVAGGQTMDAFVAELLRPLLREWLDAHLPEIVERMVAKEIARITGKR